MSMKFDAEDITHGHTASASSASLAINHTYYSRLLSNQPFCPNIPYSRN